MTESHCLPCRKGDAGLTPEEIQSVLAALPGWQLSSDGKAFERAWKFSNFAEALAFVNRVGALAEQENHHPDIALGWGYATLRFTTHAIGGLHRNDAVMTQKVEELL